MYGGCSDYERSWHIWKRRMFFFLFPASQRIAFEYHIKFDRYSMLRSHICMFCPRDSRRINILKSFSFWSNFFFLVIITLLKSRNIKWDKDSQSWRIRCRGNGGNSKSELGNERREHGKGNTERIRWSPLTFTRDQYWALVRLLARRTFSFASFPFPWSDGECQRVLCHK